MTRISILKLFILTLMTFCTFGCSKEKEANLSPQQALNEFYAYQGAEDQLMDPLIVAGKGVVPLVITEIENPNMVKRRYAIGALGNIGDKDALPTLEKILDNNMEEDYIRCDALNSIGLIDFERAKELSRNNNDSSVECLSSLSAEILSSEYSHWLSKNYTRRTLEDARSRKHY